MILSYKDIFIQICDLMDINVLISLEQLSKSHQNIIRTHDWMTFEIKLRNVNIIRFVTNNYNFQKYNFYRSKITNLDIEKCIKLKNCHTLNLSWTKITDKSVK